MLRIPRTSATRSYLFRWGSAPYPANASRSPSTSSSTTFHPHANLRDEVLAPGRVGDPLLEARDLLDFAGDLQRLRGRCARESLRLLVDGEVTEELAAERVMMRLVRLDD